MRIIIITIKNMIAIGNSKIYIKLISFIAIENLCGIDYKYPINQWLIYIFRANKYLGYWYYFYL